MPRKSLIRTFQAPYHITNRSNNKERFYLNRDQLWDIFVEVLADLKELFRCNTHAFVLMENHYHLLISTPEANIGEAMKYLHREVARKSNRKAGRINHFFGGRYKWSLIYEETYYWNAMKYIFRNPVTAGICERVEDFPYSSLNSHSPKLEWKMVDFFRDQNAPIQLDLSWLNETFNPEDQILIRAALRRREFQLPRAPNGHESFFMPAMPAKCLNKVPK